MHGLDAFESQTLIRRFVYLLSDMSHNMGFVNAFKAVDNLITCLHYFCAFSFIRFASFWEESSIYPFTRLIGLMSTYAYNNNSKYLTINITTVLFSVAVLSLLSVIAFFSVDTHFTSERSWTCYILHLNFLGANLIHYPSIAKFIHTLFHPDLTVDISTYILLVLTIGISFAVLLIKDSLLYSIKSNDKEFGLCWIDTPFIMKRFIFSFSLFCVSMFQETDLWIARLCIFVIVEGILILEQFLYLRNLSYTTKSLNQNHSIISIYSFISIFMFVIFCYGKLPHDLYLPFTILVGIIVYVLLGRIITYFIQKYITIIIEAYEIKDFDSLHDYPSERIAPMIGFVMHSIPPSGVFELLDWLTNEYNENFSMLSFAVKIGMAIEPNNTRTTLWIMKIKSFMDGTSPVSNKITLMHLESHIPNQIRQQNSKLILSLNEDYKNMMYGFWTEIMIGRHGLLFDISQNIYLKAIDIANAEGQLEAQIFTGLDKPDFLMNGVQSTKNVNHEELSHLSRHCDRHRHVLKFTTIVMFFLQLVGVIIAGFCGYKFMIECNSGSLKIWSFLKDMTEITKGMMAEHMLIIGKYYLQPNSSYYTMDFIYNLVYSDSVFVTKLKDLDADMANLTERFKLHIPKWEKSSNEFPFNHLLKVFHDTYEITDMGNPNGNEVNISLYRYITMMPTVLAETYQNYHIDDIFSVYSQRLFKKYAEAIFDVTNGTYESASTGCMSFFRKTCTACGICFAVFFIITLIFTIVDNHLFGLFFRPLFTIPKSAIAQLLKNFTGDKNKSAVSLMVKGNLNSLEQNAQKTYHTMSYLHFINFACATILAIIGYVFIIVYVWEIQSVGLQVMNSIKVVPYFSLLPGYLYMTLNSVLEQHGTGLSSEFLSTAENLKEASAMFVNMQHEVAEHPYIIGNLTSELGDIMGYQINMVFEVTYALSRAQFLIGKMINNKTLSQEMLDDAVGHMIASATWAPHIHSKLFESVTSVLSMNRVRIQVFIAILIEIVLLFLMILILNLRRYTNVNFIAKSIIKMMPGDTAEVFIKAMRSSSLTDKISKTENVKTFFSSAEVFEKLRCFGFLLDDNYKIRYVTSRSQSFFRLDHDEINMSSMKNFINSISTEKIDIPTPPSIIEFEASIRNKPIILRASFQPVKKLNDIKIVCIFDDITDLNEASKKLNYENNKIRLIMSQWMMPYMMDSAMNGEDIQEIMLPKAVVASFFIPLCPQNNLKSMNLIKDAVRAAIVETPSAQYIGISVQVFNVLFNDTDHCLPMSSHIQAALDFTSLIIEKVNEAGGSIHTGIAIGGPVYIRLTDTMPSIMAVTGEPIVQSMGAAMTSDPNTVIITKDIYKSMYQTGLNIQFKGESTVFGDEFIRTYSVKKGKL